MGRALRLAIVLSAATVVAATAQNPVVGRVAGRVTLTTRVRGTPLPSAVYPSRTVMRREDAVPEIRNVVVYVRGAPYRGPLPARHVTMRQENETFVPRVLAITRGTTVEFSNDDPFFHNVFSLSGAATFNLGRYPSGQSREVTFNKPGVVKVFCQIHSHMTATILVLDHPYFGVPDADGRFDLPNIPAGDYTLVGWHERVGERTVALHVRGGQTASVDLKLPVEEPR
jgi:plastocyanin